MTNFEYFKSIITPEFVASGWLDNVEDVFCCIVMGVVEPVCKECPLKDDPNRDCGSYSFRMDYLNKEHEEGANNES